MGELNAPTKRSKLLPDNAYRKLEEGEVYKPIVAPGDLRAEVTRWSVSVGLVMTIIFAAACVYIALRAGNGIEASIPIAILAIFFGKLRKIKSTILENVIVQSIGQASGVVAAGAAFLVPAIYINGLEPEWWQIFLACFIGGSLGVVLIIPLRKYFVKDLHGDLPFPEATAVNEILCSGESSGPTAGKVLIIAFFLGAVFDFMIEFFHLWPGKISTTSLLGSAGETMAASGFEITIFGIAALFGLGYIIGIKYASIIASGSVLAVLIMVPAIVLFGSQMDLFQYAGTSYNISSMSPGSVFSAFVKPIGIGAIALSGVIGIIRMGGIVMSSITLGFKGFKGGVKKSDEPRTEIDMNPKNVLLIQFGMAVLFAVLFFVVAIMTVDSATGETYTVVDSIKYAVVGALVGFVLSFLFTPVAAQAIAIVGVNPVSGMTLITVVFTILILVAFGLKGEGGMFVALIVGTAVCTALSTSGALISDFKIGYWIGATPRQQERWKFLGLVVAALVVAFVIPLMDSSYHFLVEDPETLEMVSNEEQLPAPQANMIAAVSKGLLDDPAAQPWLLYGLGAIMAIVLYMGGVPMLAFALGMYLPIGINMAVLLGAVTAFIVGKTGGSQRVRKARSEQGILIASGMMAGAAILGIISATTRVPDIGAPIRHASVGVEIHLVSQDIKKAIQKDLSVKTASDEFVEAFEKENANWKASKEFKNSVREIAKKGGISREIIATASMETKNREAARQAIEKISGDSGSLSGNFLKAMNKAVEAERLGTRASSQFLAAMEEVGASTLGDAVEEKERYASFVDGVKAEVEDKKLPGEFQEILKSEVVREAEFEAFLDSVKSGVSRGKVSQALLGKVEERVSLGMISKKFLEAVKAEAVRGKHYEKILRSVKVEAENGTISNTIETLEKEMKKGVVSESLLDAVKEEAFADSLVEKAGSWSDSDVVSVLNEEVFKGRLSREVADAVKTLKLLGEIKTAAGNGTFFRALETIEVQLQKDSKPEDMRKAVLAVADAGPAMALDESAKEWYRGRMGNSIALIMLLLLGFSCFILARWGAKGAIREEDELS